MATRRTDVELVKGVLVRQDDCFEELIERYASKVLNLALRITRCQEDAEEILQEVFITVLTKVQSFEHKAQFSSWLYRVTMNASFMKIFTTVVNNEWIVFRPMALKCCKKIFKVCLPRLLSRCFFSLTNALGFLCFLLLFFFYLLFVVSVCRL